MPSVAPKHDESNLMEMTTTQTKPFKNLFEGLKENIDKARLRWEQDGLHIEAMDESSIIAIKLHLVAEEFEHYYLARTINGKEGEPLELHVSIQSLNKALQGANNADTIHIIYDGAEPDYLTVVVKNEDRKEMDSNDIPINNIDLEDISKSEIDIPRESYSTILQMPSGDFDNICKRLKKQEADKTTVIFDGSRLTFKYNVKRTRGRITRDSGAIEDGKIKCVHHNEEKSDIFCTLTSRYLHDISKCAKIDSKATVEICLDPDTEVPVRFEFRVGTLGKIIFLLAPVIQDDEL